MNHIAESKEAIEFLKVHSEWLSSNWGTSPEGREYKKKFDDAINKLEITIKSNEETK